MADYQRIPEFYVGRKILITGGTGFIGKVLIWKLLQSCPLIDTIYVLLRSKHNKTVECRKKELLDCPIFDNFRRTGNLRALEKVVVVTGDVLQPELGLSELDKHRLIEDVSIVFYGSALLKMDASLRNAIDANTLSVIRAIDLAQKMKNLISFMYTSTAYCCCDEPEVEEKLYLLNMNPHDIITFATKMNLSKEILDKVTPDLIHPLPNTYIFSKRLTELVLAEYKGKLPLIITRPTIVAPSLKEPCPGWIDNLNGVVGVCIAGAKGVLRTMLADSSKKMDSIAVDLVCNALIAIPWKEARKDNMILSNIPIYNVTAPESERKTWSEIRDVCVSVNSKEPFELMLWYPNFDFEMNKFRYHVKVFLFQIVPAALIDALLFLFQKKQFMLRIQKKILSGSKVFQFFAMHQWHFRIDNLHTLWDNMTPEDKEEFPLIPKNIDFFSYMEDSLKCLKMYLLNESTDNVRWRRFKLNMFYTLHILVRVIFYYILLKYFVKLLNYMVF